MKTEEREEDKGAGIPEHWLHTAPTSYEKAFDECQRLQRTIKVLIAIGFVTERKAEQAYEIARTE